MSERLPGGLVAASSTLPTVQSRRGLGVSIMGRSRFQLRQLDTPRRGQATIELVFLALFLLIPLLAGITDITRAYFEHVAVVHAANVSARWATLSSSEQYCSGYGSVEQVVADDLSNVPVQI